MIHLDLNEFCTDLRSLWNISHEVSSIASDNTKNSSTHVSPELQSTIQLLLKKLFKHAQKLELDSLRDRILRLSKMFDTVFVEWVTLSVELRILLETIEDATKRKRTLVIYDAKYMIFLDEIEKWKSIKESFDNIQADVDGAMWCYVTDNNTACVFHAMMILERGLEKLSNLLNVAYGHDQWLVVIQNIETEIRKMQGLKKGEEKTKKLTYYSKAAMQFIYFKDAWRNHVSHARSSYDEHQAVSIILHVREFMQQLAIDLDES